jgi:hypothetical protein
VRLPFSVIPNKKRKTVRGTFSAFHDTELRTENESTVHTRTVSSICCRLQVVQDFRFYAGMLGFSRILDLFLSRHIIKTLKWHLFASNRVVCDIMLVCATVGSVQYMMARKKKMFFKVTQPLYFTCASGHPTSHLRCKFANLLRSPT